MILFMSDWEIIRGEFSEAEKDTLNAAITGETICPRGCVIDTDKAGMLYQKIMRLLDEHRHPELYSCKEKP